MDQPIRYIIECKMTGMLGRASRTLGIEADKWTPIGDVYTSRQDIEWDIVTLIADDDGCNDFIYRVATL